jgi:DNA-binding transcriptional ArsR family regulator
MKKVVPDRERCERVASLMKILSHPQRLFILCHLHGGEMTVSELESCVDAAQPVISQHLTRMRLEGLVDSRRDGNFVLYRLADDKVGRLLETFQDIFGGK